MSELFDGDATFCATFNKKTFGKDGAEYTYGFKPPKGEKFVVVLIGTAPKNATDFDVESALNKLGFYRKAEGSQ